MSFTDASLFRFQSYNQVLRFFVKGLDLLVSFVDVLVLALDLLLPSIESRLILCTLCLPLN